MGKSKKMKSLKNLDFYKIIFKSMKSGPYHKKN